MARHGLSRPVGTISKQSPISHERWQPDHFTGTLHLMLTIPAGQFVSPGTGRLVLAELEGREIVAQQAARAAGRPVVPGSGIKGAVRTLYELLSFSCDPLDRQTRCTKAACCDACSLFGLLGWSGRISFSDAVPVQPGSVQAQIQKVPIPWQPDAAKTDGDFRLYDLEEARMLDPDRRVWMKRPKLAREVFTGELQTRLTFWNVTPEELGRLLLATGLGANDQTRFLLRLGGVKYDGKGGAQMTPQALHLTTPRRAVLTGEECKERCARWIRIAHESAWGSRFWPTLKDLAATLQTTD
jgi:hypothetical protein